MFASLLNRLSFTERKTFFENLFSFLFFLFLLPFHHVGIIMHTHWRFSFFPLLHLRYGTLKLGFFFSFLFILIHGKH